VPYNRAAKSIKEDEGFSFLEKRYGMMPLRMPWGICYSVIIRSFESLHRKAIANIKYPR
jgi:hypothetical protein